MSAVVLLLMVWEWTAFMFGSAYHLVACLMSEKRNHIIDTVCYNKKGQKDGNGRQESVIVL